MFYFALTNKLVSIHAPTWGATSGLSVTIARIHVSIHAPTRGATNVSLFSCSQSMFQSTHPLGVRLLNASYRGTIFVFQSTHPLGVRQLLCDVSFTHSVVSIHAPTRGATLLLMLAKLVKICFNPRTHSGCDKMIESFM